MPSDDFQNLTHFQKFNKGNLAFVIFCVPKKEIHKIEETKAKLERIQRLECSLNLDNLINNYTDNLEIKEISFYEK